MPVLVICKIEADLKKIEIAIVMTTFPHVKSMGKVSNGQMHVTPE